MDLLQGYRAAHEVNVGVDDTGEDEAASRVDDPGSEAAIGVNFLFRADGDDFAVANCQRFRPGLPRIDGVNPAVDDDRVGRSWPFPAGDAFLELDSGLDKAAQNKSTKPVSNLNFKLIHDLLSPHEASIQAGKVPTAAQEGLR